MSADKIHQLRLRSDKFVANLDNHVADVVEHNERLLQLNKAQLKASKTAKGGDLVNSLTGSPFYSPAYGRKKGYTKPDLFVTGQFYRDMDILMSSASEWFITSFSRVTVYLRGMYTDNIFGIQDKKKAQNIGVGELADKYKRMVL